MLQVLQGVDYMHQRRVLHRDLKLENLMLNKDIEVKIGDFGIATRLIKMLYYYYNIISKIYLYFH